MNIKGNFTINKKDNKIDFSGNLDENHLISLIKKLIKEELNIPTQQNQLKEVQSVEVQTVEVQTVEVQTPFIQTVEVPFIQTVEVQKPSIQTIEVQTPFIQTVEVQTVDVQKSSIQTIEVQKPFIQTVEVQTVEVQKPFIQTVEVQTVEVQKPFIQTVEVPFIQTVEDTIKVQNIENNDRKQDGRIQKWKINEKYTIGDIISYKTKIYECLYEHISLSNWAPEHTKDVLWTENVNKESNVEKTIEKTIEKKDNLAQVPNIKKDILIPRYVIVSVGEIIKIPEAEFYETNNPSVFQILPKNSGIKVLKVGQGCIRFKQQEGFELNHILGVFVKGFESGLSNKRALIGTISDDDPIVTLPFWLDFNNYSDLRYTCLNGGPNKFGWKLNYSTKEYNTDQEGKKAIDFIRNSQSLGMTPVFVYHNVCGGNESYQTNLLNINSINYMMDYYTDLEFLLDIINKESPRLPVWIIFEPNFLGYLMQNSINQNPPLKREGIFVHTSPLKMLKTVKELAQNLVPNFDSTLEGFIKSINWLTKFKCPQAHFGWQISTWSSSYPSKNIPGNKGLMKVSDFIDHKTSKAFIISEAKEIAQFCLSIGVNFLTDFFVIDKGKMSFRGINAESLKNAESSSSGWNSDHWYNYLLFCMTLKSTINKDCILWQLPTGHLNRSTSINPKTRAPFKELQNVPGEYEDSTVTFFFGDSFVPQDQNEYNYFLQNKYDSELVESDGHGTIIWKGIAEDLRDYGISAVIFGTDTVNDTHAGGLSKKITDDNFFFTKVRKLVDN